MSKQWKMAGAIIIVTLVIVLTGVTITAAQDEPAVPADPELPDYPMPYGGGRRGPAAGAGFQAVNSDAMQAAMAEVLGITIEDLEAALAEGQTLYALAQELGIEWSELLTAMQAVHEDALQEAVESGFITQEQADWMANRGQMGPRGFAGGMRGGRFGGRPMGHGFMAVDETAMHEAIAGALGIAVEDFEAAITEGQTPFSLAEELGVDWADVQAAMQAAHQQALQAAVEAGLITQEQADWMAGRGQMGPGGSYGGGMRGGQLGGRGWQALSES